MFPVLQTPLGTAGDVHSERWLHLNRSHVGPISQEQTNPPGECPKFQEKEGGVEGHLDNGARQSQTLRCLPL